MARDRLGRFLRRNTDVDAWRNLACLIQFGSRVPRGEQPSAYGESQVPPIRVLELRSSMRRGHRVQHLPIPEQRVSTENNRGGRR